MALYLVNPAVDMSLELFVSSRLEEALTIQYERIKDRRVRDTFIRKLESRLESLLAESIDWDLKEPTEAQLNFAVLVAKKLGVPLPGEARKYRFHTAMFLETYADQLRASPAPTEQLGDCSGAVAARQLVEARLRESGDGEAPI